jgi:hypothetical protein
MSRHRHVPSSMVLESGLLAIALLIPGCFGGDGNPPRNSVSAPRAGGAEGGRSVLLRDDLGSAGASMAKVTAKPPGKPGRR